VKAFERMEKREQHQRKKEAQLEQSKKPKDKEKDSGAGKSEHDSGRSDGTSNSPQKLTKQHSAVSQRSFIFYNLTLSKSSFCCAQRILFNISWGLGCALWGWGGNGSQMDGDDSQVYGEIIFGMGLERG